MTDPTPSKPSRYGKGDPYDHKYHAGNIGDVLKHCALISWLRALQTDAPLWICDTHAGAGMHALSGPGEWSAGIGRLDALDKTHAPRAVQDYLAAAGDRRRAGKGGLYPGSPALIRALLRPEDRLTLCDMADTPRQKLEHFYAEDASVEVRGGDGLLALKETAEAAKALRPVGFIDPPFVSKNEWIQVTDALIAVSKTHPDAALMAWYPIKSLMRPHTMAAAVREAGIPAVTLDLITTPLRQKRKALNGSGVLIVRPPEGLIGTMAEALPWLGDALAHPSASEWTAVVRRWTPTAPSKTEDDTPQEDPNGGE